MSGSYYGNLRVGHVHENSPSENVHQNSTIWKKKCPQKFPVHKNSPVLLLKYPDLSNKPADPNKRVGREDFLIHYMTNFEQGGMICHLLHEKIRLNVLYLYRFYFMKPRIISSVAFLLDVGTQLGLTQKIHLFRKHSNFLGHINDIFWGFESHFFFIPFS